jgi:glutaredoxin
MTPTIPTPTSVTVVQSPACHFCDDAEAALDELAAAFPLAVTRVDAADPRGQALVREHRAPMYPLVLVDGAFFSFGRLPRKKLRTLLTDRYPVAVA